MRQRSAIRDRAAQCLRWAANRLVPPTSPPTTYCNSMLEMRWRGVILGRYPITICSNGIVEFVIDGEVLTVRDGTMTITMPDEIIHAGVLPKCGVDY